MGCGSSTAVSDQGPKRTVSKKDPNGTVGTKNEDEQSPNLTTEGFVEDDTSDSEIYDSGYEEATIPEDESHEFHPFIEFPTHLLLEKANIEYTALRQKLKTGDDGELLPYPTPSKKVAIFNKGKCKDVDTRAVETPESYLVGTLEALVKYLLGKCKDDLSKIRAFFRFMTAQDVEASVSVKGDYGENNPIWYLKNIKQETGDYTDLFLALCRVAGIRSKKLSGYVKGESVEPGEELKESDTGSWAVCLVNNQWRLVDVHWGARHVTGGSDGDWLLIDDNGKGCAPPEISPKQLKYQCNEYYFLPDPHELIHSHFPKQGEEWQLLARPVTLREFQEVAYLKPAFFEHGLEVMSHPRCVITATDGEVILKVGLPEDGKRGFMYRLWFSTKAKNGTNNSANVGDFQLERYVFMQQRQRHLECKMLFPIAGRFKFELFATNSGNGDDKDTTTSYSLACVYIIDNLKAKEDCVALPENTRKEWGPGLDLQNAGLTAITHKDGAIEAEDGKVELRFKAEKEVEILHELHSNSKDKEDLRNYVTHHNEGDEVVLNVKLPESGDYALNIYAKEAGSEGKFPNVCSYLVSTDTPAFDPTPFPEITNGKLGPTGSNTGLGLTPLSHKSPYIDVPESGEVDIVFGVGKPVDLLTQFDLQKGKKVESKDRHVFIEQQKGKVTFKVMIPEAGVYALQIFGKEKDSEGNLDNIYNYIIDAKQPSDNLKPFPKLFTWDEGFELINPEEGLLKCNSTVHFTVKIPGASQVAAISSKGWTYLTKGEGDVWEADVETGDPDSELKLSAELEEGSNSFSTLLLYNIAPEDEMTKINKQQLEATKAAEKQREKEQLAKKKREDDFEKVKKNLLQAMQGRSLVDLRKAIHAVEKKRFTSRLKSEMAAAKEKLLSLERIERLQIAILEMDSATMAEIRNYRNPPAIVHEVMVSALLLLGEHEGRTRNWKECQKLCNTIGPTGLFRRVKDFNVETLNGEIANRAHKLLSKYYLDDVSVASAGAGTFYAWTLGMIEETRILKPSSRDVEPANLKRQKEIFNLSKK